MWSLPEVSSGEVLPGVVLQGRDMHLPPREIRMTEVVAKCAEDGCESPRSPKAGYGLCGRHYQAHKRAGTIANLKPTHLRTSTAEEKFLRSIVVTK